MKYENFYITCNDAMMSQAITSLFSGPYCKFGPITETSKQKTFFIKKIRTQRFFCRKNDKLPDSSKQIVANPSQCNVIKI